jgi:hypothetical protein
MCLIFLSNFTQILIFLTEFKEVPDIKFNENIASENTVAPCRVDRHDEAVHNSVIVTNKAEIM